MDLMNEGGPETGTIIKSSLTLVSDDWAGANDDTTSMVSPDNCRSLNHALLKLLHVLDLVRM